MTYIFGNWLQCLRNDQNMWEMTSICGKWLKYVGKSLDYLKTRLKNVENDLEIWELAKIFGKWRRYMGHGLSV